MIQTLWLIISVAGIAYCLSSTWKIQALQDEIKLEQQDIQYQLDSLQASLDYYQDLFFKERDEKEKLQAQLDRLLQAEKPD